MNTRGEEMEWATNVSEEYGVALWRVLALFYAINKHHGMVETKNIIEKGLISRGQDICG